MPKKMITSEKQEVKEYLDEKPSTITAKFQLQKLEMKDIQWRMKIKVGDILPRTYHRYKMVMNFDEAPYERRIAALNDEIADIRDGAQQPLFKGETYQRIKDIEDEIEEEQESREKYRGECPTITIPATVEELKYSGSDTILVMLIPDMVIDDLNVNKLKFGMYKLEMTPEF